MAIGDTAVVIVGEVTIGVWTHGVVMDMAVVMDMVTDMDMAGVTRVGVIILDTTLLITLDTTLHITLGTMNRLPMVKDMLTIQDGLMATMQG